MRPAADYIPAVQESFIPIPSTGIGDYGNQLLPFDNIASSLLNSADYGYVPAVHKMFIPTTSPTAKNSSKKSSGSVNRALTFDGDEGIDSSLKAALGWAPKTSEPENKSHEPLNRNGKPTAGGYELPEAVDCEYAPFCAMIKSNDTQRVQESETKNLDSSNRIKSDTAPTILDFTTSEPKSKVLKPLIIKRADKKNWYFWFKFISYNMILNK